MKGSKRVRVYHDAEGQIVSMVEIKEDKEAPLAHIAPIPETHVSEIELTGELAEAPLLDIHTKFRLDLREKKPRLLKMTVEKIQE